MATMTSSKWKYAYHADIVIIGNGVAGNSAAIAARRHDKDVSVLIVGNEPYPAYAAGALPDYLAGYIDREMVFIKREVDYERQGIQILLGEEVLTIDAGKKMVHTANGSIGYGKLIIATGSEPIRPQKIPGIDLAGNQVLKSLAQVDAIAEHGARSVVVVGSGAIGIEGALALKARGVEQVTLVELMDWLLPRSIDSVTSKLVTKEIKRQGIQVLTGESVTAVMGEERVEAVKTTRRKILCDMVIWSVGVKPVVQVAKNAGVVLGETGGIYVDEYMRTNLQDVYACGDCAESTDRLSGRQVLNQLWEAAARQGEIAGGHCVGIDRAFQGSFAVLLTYLGEEPVLAFGYTEKDLADTEYDVWEYKSPQSYRRILSQNGCIVGVQMFGTLEGAGLLLAQLQKGVPIFQELPAQANGLRYPATQRALMMYLQQFHCLEAGRGVSQHGT